MTNLRLTDNFPAISQDDWQVLVEKGLRGDSFESLIRYTDDGLPRGPLSSASDRLDDIKAIPRAGAPLQDDRPWHIAAPVRDPDIAHANHQLREDLTGGASAARITLGDTGITIGRKNDLKRLFDAVHMDLIPIAIAPNNDHQNITLFNEYHTSHIYFGLDPKTENLQSLAREAPENWRMITINATRVSEMGGTAVQELAYFAASTAYTMRTLGPDLAARHIGAELTTDQDSHLSIAKIRAARRIYARIADAFSLNDVTLPIHVITAKHMMQSTDPWTNMLRVMSAGFGAVIGGADFITTRPFTDAIGHATGFGHRIARNMQLMMMKESHLGQVNDAAFGSYFHETMTEHLARAAWTEFQQIETEGGLENTAPFKARIERMAKARNDRNDPILGVTLHPSQTTRAAKTRRSAP